MHRCQFQRGWNVDSTRKRFHLRRGPRYLLAAAAVVMAHCAHTIMLDSDCPLLARRCVLLLWRSVATAGRCLPQHCWRFNIRYTLEVSLSRSKVCVVCDQASTKALSPRHLAEWWRSLDSTRHNHHEAQRGQWNILHISTGSNWRT